MTDSFDFRALVPQRVVIGVGAVDRFLNAFRPAFPDVEFRAAPHSAVTDADLEWADTYIGFRRPPLPTMGRVRWVHCSGAGIDSWMYPVELPRDILLTRTSESFGPMIAEWALSRALAFTQRLRDVEAQQARREWADVPVRFIRSTKAVVVGTGDVGSHIAAAFVARRVARPLSELSAAATTVAQGGLAPHVPEEGPEDVRHAAAAFNAMTDQVSRTMESQRQLLSAVGHDLRTPITAMRINIEFVNDAELRERLERNLEELQELTEAVLSAAKGAGGEPMRHVDIAALVESLCADLIDMGKPVTWLPHDPVPMNCRPNEIRRAVRNLIENAIAYGEEATVSIQGRGPGYEIVVEDKGPGIPEADRQRVFEPFVRLETSRNTETGGTGLGLTLVKAIAAGHGGTVALENRAAGGLRARLYLPIPVPAT